MTASFQYMRVLVTLPSSNESNPYPKYMVIHSPPVTYVNQTSLRGQHFPSVEKCALHRSSHTLLLMNCFFIDRDFHLLENDLQHSRISTLLTDWKFPFTVFRFMQIM